MEGSAVLADDDTKNRKREAERSAAAERHAALVAAQQEVALADRDMDAVLRIITCRAQGLTAADGVVVEMADGDDIVYRADRHPPDPTVPVDDGVEHLTVPVRQ